MIGRPGRFRSRRPRETGGSYKKQSVFSYRSSRNNQEKVFNRGDNEPADKHGSVRWWFKRIPYVFCGLALLGACIYSLIVDPHAQMEVIGKQTYLRSKQDYQNNIDEKLASSPFYRFKPTLNSDKIARQIGEEFPELQEVVIHVPLFRHRPVVEFHLATPGTVVVSGSISYVVDRDGKVLFGLNDKAASLDTSTLPKVIDDTNAPVNLGKTLLSTSQTQYIHNIYLQAKAANKQVESMDLNGGGEQLDVRFTGNKYYVKFNLQADARQSFGAYIAVSEKLGREGDGPSEYIDVRLPERVYIK